MLNEVKQHFSKMDRWTYENIDRLEAVIEQTFLLSKDKYLLGFRHAIMHLMYMCAYYVFISESE